MGNFTWMSEQGARILVDHLHDGIYVIEEGVIVFANKPLANILGYQVKELIGRSFIGLIHEDDRQMALERYRSRLSGEDVPIQYDIRLLTASGSKIICALNVGLHSNTDGRVVTVGSVRDVTLQKAELAELEASELELQSIFDQLPDVFYRTNMQGVITKISPSCYDVIGYRPEVMIGTALAYYYKYPEARQKIVQAITEGGGKAIRVEAELRHKDGSSIWISTNAFVRFDSDGKPAYIEGVARDISNRKHMEEQLLALSRIDVLTDTFNRRYYMDKSEGVIELMRRYQRPASMMMMDLDHFKNINDKYGHHVGDMALIAFASVCRKEIREADILGRLGGEEFALMLPETSLQSASVLAERIREATAEISIPFDGNFISFTVSIGLVELGKDDLTLDSVIRRADLAMYQAKEKGRNQVVTM